jgi:hypothetical protein
MARVMARGAIYGWGDEPWLQTLGRWLVTFVTFIVHPNTVA